MDFSKKIRLKNDGFFIIYCSFFYVHEFVLNMQNYTFLLLLKKAI